MFERSIPQGVESQAPKAPEIELECAPTWEGVLPILLAALTDGNETGRTLARKELRRMAQAADRGNATQKTLSGLAAEVVRVATALHETGDFPVDTCPADLYTLALEAQR